jgi:DnaD/phage-associated family protein
VTSSNLLQPSPFKGFPGGKVRLTRIPAQFFSELLPQIDHLGELKVTLYTLGCLDRMEGSFRYLRYSDYARDERLMQGLGAEPTQALAEALQRAAGRGTLLMAEIPGEAGAEAYYFLNTPRGRAAIEAIKKGNWRPTGDPQLPIALDLDRPNIFQLYEDNIGPLTPLIADTLKEAEQTYRSEWIEDAIRIAVENNVRRWRYIQAILESWQKEGRNEQNRGDTEKDRRRYIEGPFAEFVKH